MESISCWWSPRGKSVRPIEPLKITWGTADLAEKLGIPITGPHKGDDFWIELLPKQAAAYGFEPARTFTPDRWLEDGDTVQVGKVTLQVIHAPGHTPGHVVFYQPSGLA